uniref:A-kinase anchor protein 7 RI-RII subunit-binding domain-containing protein n=1 Tax=Esox lucius TaxID=8010 RepID=A0A6Q2WTT0_ESOLU
MGQLCCFPFSRTEEKISVKRVLEPDDEELVSLSKRLVEDAVLRAVQQYMDETRQNGAASSDPARPSDNLNANSVNATGASSE